MPLRGHAFVAIWHGIQPGGEDEYLAWHSKEHFPERLGIPGFLRGRRFVRWEASPHPTLTLYEGNHLETFRSPGYLARLNAPTEWTGRVQPTMTDFLRGGCETILSHGHGIGGAVTAVRLSGPAGDADFEERLLPAALGLAAPRLVTGIGLGRHRPEVTGAPTAETALRPSRSKDDFSHVLLIEGVSRGDLLGRESAVLDRLAATGATDLALATYDLSFCLEYPS